jgi:hypothetical protein
MDRRERQLEERIAHLEIEVKMEREWNQIPEELKPTSKGRWNQMAEELKAQESRRLGWPKNY